MSSVWAKRAGPLALVIVLLLVLGGEAPFVLGLRHALFDGYQKLFPRVRKSAPAVIVAIDEHALARHGQWPWPRTRVAQLLASVAGARPAASSSMTSAARRPASLRRYSRPRWPPTLRAATW